MITMVYLPLIFIRRLFMISILLLQPSFENNQIIMQLHTTLYICIFTGYVRPYKSQLQNTQEFFNEWTVVISSYHLFCFTDWITDYDRRFEIGWSLISVIIVNVLFNFALVLTIVCHNTIRTFKIKYHKHCYMKYKKETDI